MTRKHQAQIKRAQKILHGVVESLHRSASATRSEGMRSQIAYEQGRIIGATSSLSGLVAVPSIR